MTSATSTLIDTARPAAPEANVGAADLAADRDEPLFVEVPGVALGAESEVPRKPFVRRHRVALAITTALVVAVIAAVAVFAYQWNHSGPHELSTATAYQRFHSGATGQPVDPGTLHPAPGVYTYSGHGSEHISVPPKSQTEGPTFPGTVTYQPNGCWVWRMDYSDSHWQSSTFCDLNGNLVEPGRAGWYRWNLVALSVADTATFTCPIHTDPVHQKGTNTYLGTEVLRVAGTRIDTLHFRETSTFSGGQWGTNVADLWISTVNGLPVKGSWTTKVSSPTFLGTSTLTGGASFVAQALTPHS
jgi:hypothetical protein